ncbi:esterase/lipase family protein [Nocardiopsis sp. LOL_012]|uniref:esterase/lipase family protein n=1 Tax=Nocardiopsis sp. LOL_012 TaxID=3345409 RepID=UPI003A837910
MRSPLAPVAAALALAFAVLTPMAAQADERNPVLFVHGYSGNASNWDEMIDDFVDDGWDRDRLYAITYDYNASNVTTAELIADEVDDILDETGAEKVDIVAHSMGSLSSRWYVKFLGGTETVDNWVSLAGPNEGSWVELPCVQTAPGCAEVVRGSDFLDQLNGGDPTPGDVSYTTFRSFCDFIVLPSASVSITGADNNSVGCVSHISFVSDNGVSDDVRDTLA